MEFTHITCVLEVLILNPTCLAKLFSLSVLACMLCWLVDRRARSSAMSRSSSWESPLDASWSVCCGVGCDPVYGDQEEYRGDDAPLSHSGLHGKPLCEIISRDDTTLKMYIECFYDWDDLWWYSIGVQYVPEGVSVDTVEGLPEVHKVDVEGWVPFQALPYDVTQSKDLVHTSSSLPEACLLLSYPGLNGCLHLVEKDSAEHLAWNGQKGDSTPAVAVLNVAFLGGLWQ